MISLHLKACLGGVRVEPKPGTTLSDQMYNVLHSDMPYQVKLIVMAALIHRHYPNEVEIPEYPNPLDESNWKLNAAAVTMFPRPSYELCQRMAEITNRAFHDYRRTTSTSCPVPRQERKQTEEQMQTPSEGTTIPDFVKSEQQAAT